MADIIVQKIITLFNEQGDSEYGGEPVTQGEHALQAAHLALAEGAASSLVTASLLHDIGHLLHALPDDAPEQGIDDLHEELGNRFLVNISRRPSQNLCICMWRRSGIYVQWSQRILRF
jgi:predicted HD phosphohydrolase